MKTKIATTDDLLKWLSCEQSDVAPHTVNEVIDNTNDWLEDNCDWIQWVLPIPEQSAFNCFAPVLPVEKFVALTKQQRTTIIGMFFRFRIFLLF